MDLLRMLAHPKHHLKTTPEVLREINALSLEEASEAINELSGPKHYIQGSGNLLTLLQHWTLDNHRSFSIKALIDSGCTGSSIDAGFIAAKGINTQKLARPIPVCNADGTLNAGGVITDYVVLQMKIGDHVERLTLGVTDLEKGELFIGHEWLKHHNPFINWTEGTLNVNHCPKTCSYAHHLFQPEQTEEDENLNCVDGNPELTLSEGERLFAFDFDGYMKQGAASHIQAHTTKS